MCWAKVALASNDERCSIVSPVFLGHWQFRAGAARGCIYVGPTRSVRHVITWMGGRYMKDWWAWSSGVGFIHLYATASFLLELLKRVRAYIVTGTNSIGSFLVHVYLISAILSCLEAAVNGF